MKRRLLLADDSLTIQRVVELTFSGQDVEVIAVGDGDQAIARIAGDRPDIVLADIGMPRRSGYDVCAFVKQRQDLAHIPVLLLAGAFEPVDDARVRQVQCDGVVVKPFEPQHLVARVRELLGDERTIQAPAAASADPPRAPEPPAAAGSDDVPLMPLELALPPARAADRSLDQYFDRLDAAFATFASTQPPPGPTVPAPLTASELLSVPSEPVPRGDDEPHVVPTIDELLGGAFRTPGPEPGLPASVMLPPVEPPDAPATMAASAAPPAPTGPSGNPIADAFDALFAVERGEADAASVRLPLSPAPPAVTDEWVDVVTRRVVERLAPDAARTVVAEVVSEVAERLVREEIERIRRMG